jgi:hypothetical protein
MTCCLESYAKIRDIIEMPDKCMINIVFHIDCTSHKSIEFFYALQQIRNYLVCITIVGVSHTGALSEYSVSLIKE